MEKYRNSKPSVMTAEDIEDVVNGKKKINPNQVGLRAQGSSNRYHAGYHPPRKTILGSNGSSF